MITPNDFRTNLIFEDKGRFLQVITYQHHRKSQARAKVTVKARDLDSGSVLELTYSSDEKLRDVDVRKRDFQYLYADGSGLHFMDTESYDQQTLPKERLGEGVKFLVENMELIGVFLDGNFRSVELPANVAVKVATAEPGVKGDTVSNLMKNATTETGVELKVPLFVKEGDLIRVDTRTGEYIERVKE